MAGVTFNDLVASGALSDTDEFALWTGAAHEKRTLAEVKSDLAGKTPLWIPARKWEPTTTAGAGALAKVETTTNAVPLEYRVFSGTVNEFVFFPFVPPRAWDEGVLSYQAAWYNPSAGTAVVQWTMQALAQVNDGSLDTALGTAVTVNDTEIAADDLLMSPESGNVTPGGTAGVDPLLILKFGRNGAVDASTAAARLLGVKVYLTLNDTNDN